MKWTVDVIWGSLEVWAVVGSLRFGAEGLNFGLSLDEHGRRLLKPWFVGFSAKGTFRDVPRLGQRPGQDSDPFIWLGSAFPLG